MKLPCHQRLATSDQRPATSDQRPATSDQRPATSDQRPATSDSEPCAEVVKRKVAGFTLIELAIGLVIIGLLIGGILVGKDIIDAAENRSAIAHAEELAAMTNAFKSKYGCLPGDCNSTIITTLGGTICPAQSNAHSSSMPGNGQVEGVFNGITCESSAFADHLQLAGFNLDVVPDSYNIFHFIRTKAFGGKAALVPFSWNAYGRPGNWFVIDSGIFHTGLNMPASNQGSYVLSANRSHAIDLKIDDGKPLTGIVQILGYEQGGSSWCSTAIPAFLGACIGYGNQGSPEYGRCATSNTPSANYVNSNSNVDYSGCKLAFKQPF